MLFLRIIVLLSLPGFAARDLPGDRYETAARMAIREAESAKDVPTRVVPEIRFSDTVEILMPGLFHGEDVFDGALERPWFGIYTTDVGCSIRRFEVDFEHAVDPVLDGEGEMTAWSIFMEDQHNSADFLISGIELPTGLSEAELLSCATGLPDGTSYPVTLEPGVSIAVSDSRRIEVRADGMADYQVEYLDTERPGQVQVIAGSEWMEDTYMSLLWAGDLNADGIPDLLMNTSYKYSFSNIELFVSDTENSGHLRSMAVFRFTSC